jgi:PAS domain S-box-containing protein
MVDVNDSSSDSQSSFSSSDEIERVCIRNLLANREERVFFKDRESRFLLVSAGWLLAEGQGRPLDQVIGKTDFEIFSGLHAAEAFADDRRVIETGEPIIAKLERETFDDRSAVWVSTTKLPLRDATGNTIGTWGIARDVTTEVESEEAMRRHAEGQGEITELGRLALKEPTLEELFDHAVGAAWRVFSSDCAWLLEHQPDASDPVVRAEIGWPDGTKGARIAGERRSLSGYAVRSSAPIVVEDWELERRFHPSGIRLAHGVRSSVGVLVGAPDSPFGVLEVDYTHPRAVPSDCLPFLEALANVLGEAIENRNSQELIRRQAKSLEAMTHSLRGLVSEQERLVEQIPGVVMVFDARADGARKFVFVSRQSEMLLGVEPSAFLTGACGFTECVHVEDRERLSASIREPAAAGLDPLPAEFRFIRPDGREVWLREVAALVYSERGLLRVQAVLFDITDAKQAELERERLELDLRLAQKLEAIGSLAAGVAHEINTPVQFIGDSVTFLKEAVDELLKLTNVYSELLHTEEPIDKEERQHRAVAAEQESDLEYLTERVPPAFERALEGIARVSSIVRAMRQFAHPSSQRAPIDINEGLRTTLIVATNEYKYVADIELDLADLPLVMASAGDLNQVFLNLIVNAAHAIQSRVGDSGQRGTITLRTRADQTAVLITVSDTGCGIPDELAERVFDPFFTTKAVGHGTGQGLAIAHTIIVERHHGTINFEPSPTGGTTFRIQLPLNDPAAEGEILDAAA